MIFKRAEMRHKLLIIDALDELWEFLPISFVISP